jgi:hypothetical protein
MIPNLFDTALNCAATYQQFFLAHLDHTDPVCFRVVMFWKFFHLMCVSFEVIVNINIWNPKQLEFLLNLKL